jgi:flagellar secretion chaperone FliS
MAMQNPYQTYQQNSITTASPQELTFMLYNGCLKFIKLAKKAMEENDVQAKHSNILKAQAIVQELNVTLNMDIELSQNMRQLYDYMLNRLVEANIKNDAAILEEVESYVVEFRDVWKEVMKAGKK